MGKFKKQTCCFTGHRNIPPGEQTKILTRVRHRLIPLIQSGIIYYGVGGALGFDTLVAEMLVELKKENSRLRIIEVLPFEGCRDRWTPEQQLHAKNLDKKMDKIVYVSKEPSKSAYLARDRHLVDCSDYCISYCTKPTGGTAYTVKYALENQLTVYNASSFDVTSLLGAAPLHHK